MAGNGAISGQTKAMGSSKKLDNRALQYSSPCMSRITSKSVNTGRHDGGMTAAYGGNYRNCTGFNLMPAKSAQQRQGVDMRLHDVIRNQLPTSIRAPASKAVRSTCHIFHTSTTHVSAGATRTSGDNGSPADGSTTTSVDWNVDELIPKASLNLRFLRPAPIRDPRSGPLPMILRQSAGEFFDSVPGDQPPSGRRRDARDWRVEMTRLYNDHVYQFSSLYKPAARARPSTENAVVADRRSTHSASKTRSLSTSDATHSQHSGRRRSVVRRGAASREGPSVSQQKSVIGPSMRRTVSALTLVTARSSSSRPVRRGTSNSMS